MAQKMAINEFKVFPVPTELRYFTIKVFDSQIEYLNYHWRASIKGWYEFVPFQAAIEYEEKHEYELGRVSFPRCYYHLGAISHESLHMAVWYLKRTYDEPFKDFKREFKISARIFEERLCSVQEYIFGQIINNDTRYFKLTPQEVSEQARGGLEYYNTNNKPKKDDSQLEMCI